MKFSGRQETQRVAGFAECDPLFAGVLHCIIISVVCTIHERILWQFQQLFFRERYGIV